MASVLEIVRGISQALSNTHDGALDENGDPIKIGLRRDEGCPILDKRVIDGFKVSLQGDILKVNYCCETMLKDVHRGDFEGETDNVVENIVSFLKKEYKKVTKENLGLTNVGEIDIMVQRLNNNRSQLNATKKYRVTGLGGEDVMTENEDSLSSEERLDKTFRDFLSQGRGEGDKAQNDER